MRKDYFERDYGHLADSDDWTKILGSGAHVGMHTIGDIRKELEGKPADTSICLNSGGSSFYVTNVKSKFFVMGA